MMWFLIGFCLGYGGLAFIESIAETICDIISNRNNKGE